MDDHTKKILDLQNSQFVNLREIKADVYDIEKLADAFYMTGNEKVAIELYSIAKNINYCADAVRDAIAEKANVEYEQTKRDTAGILSAFAENLKK